MGASKITTSSFNIGEPVRISIIRDKNTYTHDVYFDSKNLSTKIAEKTSQTSIVWLPDASTLYKAIPDSKSGAFRIVCDTFDGKTLVGRTTSYTYSYNAVEKDCLPTVTATIVDTNDTTIALTGDSKKLIGYLSKPKVTLTPTAKNSATIKTIFIHSYGSGLTASTSPYTFSTVYSDEFICRATDSRGYVTEITQKAPYIDYEPCHFKTEPTIKRTETTSTTASITMNGYCFKGNFGKADNTLTLKYRYKAEGDSYGSYTTVTIPTDAWKTDGTFTVTANVPNLDLKKQYTFEVIAQDKLTSFGDGEEILLVQGIGDLRIAKNYVMAKNNFITGDKDNEEWRCFKARRKRDDINYDVNFGAGFGGGGISAVMEINQVTNGAETKLARFDLMKDGYLYNWFSNMSVAEIMSYAPSIVAGGQQGELLLNGGNSQPILIQWGRVSITPTGANVVTKMPILFSNVYQGIPAVYTELSTSAPSTMSISAGDITATGFNIYLQRTNTTATSIMWFAVGNGTPSLPE